MTKYIHIILFSAFFLGPLHIIGQTQKSTIAKLQRGTQDFYEEVVIDEGEVAILTKSPSRVKKMIVRGTLKIADEVDMVLYVEQLEIDGGILQAGSLEKEHQNSFSILLTSQNALAPSQIIVKNKGSLLLYGSSESVSVKAQEYISSYAKEKSLKRSIHIATETDSSFGLIHIENAKSIQLYGIRFNKLGTSQTLPALSLFETTKQPGYISHSVFENSRHTDLYLDKTSIAVENNIFLSKAGHSIVCSPSGIGVDNNIEANCITNTSDSNAFAIVAMNPYQTITNNTITVSETMNGIAITPPLGYENFVWKQEDAFFVLDGNIVKRNLKTNPILQNTGSTYGILIEDFTHSGIWRTKNNAIHSFDTGLQVLSKNIVIQNYTFENNVTGIVPGTAYVQKSTFSIAPYLHLKDTKAIWVTDSLGASEPKISDITISNYDRGIVFEGTTGKNNYFEKINFKDTAPIQFNKIGATSIIIDKDGSLSSSPLSPPHSKKEKHNPHQHHMMGHSKHPMPKKTIKEAYMLFPEKSSLRASHSKALPDSTFMYKSPKNLYGTLTISTGFGLGDPIHEHYGTFKNPSIRQQFNKHKVYLSDHSNQQEVFLAANSAYDFLYSSENHPLYDLSFEWDAAPNTWIVLKVPYAHKDVYGMHSFGGLIKASNSLQQLQKSNKTTYYNDEENAIVYIKVYNQKHYDEIVLYSPHVITEVTVADTKIPVTMRTNWKKEQIKVSYAIPERTASKIELLDYYGNVVETLYEGITQNSKTEVFVDLKKFDVETDVYLYSLTIGNAVHRGPIHTY